MKKLLKIALVVSSLLVLALTISLRSGRPYIKVTHDKSSVVIDVQTLGEYPTTVSHLRLKEVSSGNVVFELLPKDRVPQLTTFPLAVGNNSVDIVDAQFGTYGIAAPNIGSTFFLRPGADYDLSIWGTGWLPSTVRFRIQ
jgi:hypothetical protein